MMERFRPRRAVIIRVSSHEFWDGWLGVVFLYRDQKKLQHATGGKDGRRWCFCFDAEAGEPEHIEGEEWRDVVMAPAAGAAQ